MSNVNIVVLGGNITRDPETRYTPSGKAVCEFGLAWNNKYTNEAGELVENVSFFNVVAFGRTAENIAQYFQKGSPILVEGQIKEERWEDKQTGAKRSAVKVIVQRFNFIGGKKQDEGGGARPPARSQRAPEERQSYGQDDAPVDDSDVPF